MDPARLFEIAFLFGPWIIPAGFMGITYTIYRRNSRWVSAAKTQVEAEVIGFRESANYRSGRITYYPVYRFRTSLGNEIEATDMAGSWTSPLVGSKQMVFYDRDNPAQVTTREGGVPGWAWLLLLVFNLAALGMAWLVTNVFRSALS